MIKRLENHFEKVVKVLRFKFGKKQSLEMLINKEALVLAKYLRT
jgi:hypothetical protein